MVESELLGADGILRLRDLVEEASALVDAVFADVNVLFDRAQRSTLAEGG